MPKTGILLLNIGSPCSVAVKDVKKYLKTFLMDKDIINLPWPLRWLLVHGIIVPKRAKHSAANYKKIWIQNEGSPLTVLTKKFANKLQDNLGDSFVVEIGMRYSEPTTSNALLKLAESGVKKLLIVPLYPQYAEATTGSSLKQVERIIKQEDLKFNTQLVAPFYKDTDFIQSYVKAIEENLSGKTPDHYLFSFHGLPESQIRKIKGCLRAEGCCFEPNACAKGCYRAQCFATATNIAEKLQIPDSHWSVSFQSRLGRGEWLKPATDHTLEVLAQKGKKSVVVICPSFVTDCLETLEEIGMEGQNIFKQNGGLEFKVIPCLNDNSYWVDSFTKLIKNLKTDPPGATCSQKQPHTGIASK